MPVSALFLPDDLAEDGEDILPRQKLMNLAFMCRYYARPGAKHSHARAMVALASLAGGMLLGAADAKDPERILTILEALRDGLTDDHGPRYRY